MTAHQDVAGLVDKADAWDAIAEKNAEIARLRAAIAFWKATAKRFSDARKSAVRRIQSDADRLESLSQALREAEAERDRWFAAAKTEAEGRQRMTTYSQDSFDRATAAESRLAEAMKVIEPFARLATQHDEARRSGECHSWIDFLIDFHWPSEGSCTAARAFIAGNGGKDAE